MCAVSHLWITPNRHVYVMTPRHDSNETLMCVLSHYGRFFGMRHDSFHDCTSWHHTVMYATWLLHVCDITHFKRDMTFICHWRHDSRETWHIHIHDMTHSCARHDSLIGRSRHDSCEIKCRVAQMNESYRTYEWIMSHTWMGCITHYCAEQVDLATNESCRTHESVMPHAYMSPVIFHMKESNCTYTPVTSHTQMGHVANTNESCKWVMSDTRMSRVTHYRGGARRRSSVPSCARFPVVKSNSDKLQFNWVN
jgi:hypothetical protein